MVWFKIAVCFRPTQALVCTYGAHSSNNFEHMFVLFGGPLSNLQSLVWNLPQLFCSIWGTYLSHMLSKIAGFAVPEAWRDMGLVRETSPDV